MKTTVLAATLMLGFAFIGTANTAQAAPLSAPAVSHATFADIDVVGQGALLHTVKGGHHGHRNFRRGGFGHERFGHRGFRRGGFGHHRFGHRSFGHRNFGHRGFGHNDFHHDKKGVVVKKKFGLFGGIIKFGH